MASIQKDAKRKRWKVRWREGGRGAPVQATPWIYDKAVVHETKLAIEARVKARKPAGPYVTLAEAREHYLARQEKRGRRPRYLDEIRAAFRRQLDGKTKLADITPAELEAMAIGDHRVIRAFLHYCNDDLEMGVAPKQLRAPEPSRTHRPPRPLLEDQEAADQLAFAAKWGPCTAAMAHIIACYGHRAESLVECHVSAVRLSFVAPTDEKTFQAIGPGWSSLTLRVKSGEIHEHLIHHETACLLAPIVVGRPPDDHLFLDHKGAPWKDGKAFAYWWRANIGKKVSGYYRIKEWRLTSWMDEIDDADGMSITGHRTRSSYRGYLRWNTERQVSALGQGRAQGLPGVYSVKLESS